MRVKKYDVLEVWKGLEDAKRMGLVRSIGVSNFNSTDINRLLVYSDTVPAVNQIEVRKFYKSWGSVVTSSNHIFIRG